MDRINLRALMVLVLAGALIAVAVLSPVTAAITRPKVKKIATKTANAVFAQRAPDLQVTCPTDTTSAGGVCLEATARPDADWFVASETCGLAGRRLPLATELWAYQRAGGDLAGDDTSGEGVGDLTLSGMNLDWWVIRDDDQLNVSGIFVQHPYRCVATPSN